MTDLTKLVDYGTTGVAIALIIAFVYLMTKFLKYMVSREKSHNRAFEALKKSIDKNTKLTEQTYIYLKLKNGSLEKLFKDVKGIKGEKGEKGEKG